MNHITGRPILIPPQGHAQPLERVELGQKGENGFNERWLQLLVHERPNCLPIRELEPGFGELVGACMEMPTRHGPIDNLLLSADGDIVLVETKLWRNPQARREVVAQALDYAACLFEMGFEEFQAAALKGRFGNRPTPDSLIEIFPESARLEESQFADAVSLNLRKGRIMVLVVGDGIRQETERLTASLQAHAGFHFTFGLIELGAYQIGDGGLVVIPRTLARTCMIERGIVHVEDHRVSITPMEEKPGKPSPKLTITTNKFFDAMAAVGKDVPSRLQALLAKLEAIGIYPDFRRTLQLKWDAPDGATANLGYINAQGGICLDLVETGGTPRDLARGYIENLATALSVDVDKSSQQNGNWTLKAGGKLPRIDAVADRLDQWAMVAETFITALTAHYAAETATSKG